MQNGIHKYVNRDIGRDLNGSSFLMIDPVFLWRRFFSYRSVYSNITAFCFCVWYYNCAARSGENCRVMTGFLRRLFI
jgi:hypothetical protein